jgi:hypothetical protein
LGIIDQIHRKLIGDEQQPEKMTDASQQSMDEQKLVSYVKQKVEEIRANGSRVAREGQIMTNIAYLLGFDGVYYDTTTRNFRTVGQPGRSLKRGRLHANKILPSVQNRLARLCKNPPRYDVRPESMDAADKDAARLGVQVIDNVWDKQKINVKRLSLMMWVQQAGYAFMKTCWDDSLGKLVGYAEDGSPVYEGDVRVDVVPSLEVYADPLAKTLDDAQYIIHAKVRKLDYFKTHYPDRGHLVKEESAWLLSAQYEMRLNALSSQNPSSGGPQESQMQNAAIELALYERRSKKHPNGRMIVTANGVLLADKDLPCGEIPFVKFDDFIVGGSFHSESLITHMRPIQDQYNRLIQKRADWTNLLLAGKYLAPKGHGMSSESLNNQSGEVVEYNAVPGAPAPQAMTIPVMPQYAYVEEERLQSMLNEISGINEISKGTLPSAGIPAVGMQFLQEQDETRIGVVVEQHELAWSQLGMLILKYVGEYYKTPRMLKISGESMGYAVKSFQGSDLRNNYDVIVIKGSTIPNSKVLKRQEIINAFSQGLLGDPNDPNLRRKVLEMLEYGDIAEAWKDHSLDMAQIAKTIEMLEQEQVPIIDPELDNHALHIQEKNRYRKSEKFDALSEKAQVNFRLDIDAHIKAMVNMADPGLKHQKAMAEQEAMAADEMTQEQFEAQAVETDMQNQQAAQVPPEAQPQ